MGSVKLKLLLVGGGVIATHYLEGLKNSQTLELAALVDRDPSCPARALLPVPFFPDLPAALNAVEPDAVLLATPASERLELASSLLRRHIPVICEKPLEKSLPRVNALIACAEQSGVPLACIFHWTAADEVLWLKAHLKEFGEVRGVRTVIRDDYASSGTLRPDRTGLIGAWLDSGINALSFLGELFPLDGFQVLSSAERLDGDSRQIYSEKQFRIGKIPAEIVIDWTQARRDKETVIRTEAGVLHVDHSGQTVSSDGKVLFSRPVPDRLAAHYANLFRRFCFSDGDLRRVRKLHELLYEETDK